MYTWHKGSLGVPRGVECVGAVLVVLGNQGVSGV